MRWGALWAMGLTTLVLSVMASGGARAKDRRVEVLLPKGEIPEAQLLDVAIDLFDPGLPDDPATLASKPFRAAVRKSEARYFAIHLRNTLQSTGQWGSVRVVPGDAPGAEVGVGGKILLSNSKDLQLEVVAHDATGRTWIAKRYRETADRSAYAKDRVDTPDPFQSLYNRIANDLVKAREALGGDDLARVREVARLRFAADLAADPFGSYLAIDKKGHCRVVRLPAVDDPVLGRVDRIRERDLMLADTLNEHYADFYARMDKPYDEWRAYSYEEQAAYDSLHKASLLKKILGVAAVIGGLLMDPQNDAKDLVVFGGIAAIESGFKDSSELKIHKAALGELATSFEGEVTTLLVDVDGRIVQLQGSAEAQYVQWRELLRQIGATEAGLPVDINVLPAPVEVASP